MKNINLPFTIDTNTNNKKSFKIMNENELELKMKKGGTGFINSIKQILSNDNNSKNNNSKITYIKASESLKYKDIQTNKSLKIKKKK
jgi:hypothetical protein